MFPNQQFNYAQQAQQAAAMWSQYNNYWQQVASMNQNTMQQQQASYNQNIQSQVYNYNFVYYNSIVWSVCVCVLFAKMGDKVANEIDTTGSVILTGNVCFNEAQRHYTYFIL